jgi:hypothetical protein
VAIVTAGRARRVHPIAVALALATLALAGCGSSNQVKPSAYVRSLCTALSNWKNTIQSAGGALESSGAAKASRPVAKQDYQHFVSSLESATRQATSALGSAGVPAVANGKQIADRLTGAFDTASRRLAQANAQAQAIRTDSASTFQLGASSVTTEIRSALEGIASVSPGQNQQLRAAAAKEPACQALQG